MHTYRCDQRNARFRKPTTERLIQRTFSPMIGLGRWWGKSGPAATRVPRALYDQLDEMNGFTNRYHHGENLGDITPDWIDPVELTGDVRRILRLVNALQA